MLHRLVRYWSSITGILRQLKGPKRNVTGLKRAVTFRNNFVSIVWQSFIFQRNGLLSW